MRNGLLPGGATGSGWGTTYRAGTPYARFLNIYLGTRRTVEALHALRPEASADLSIVVQGIIISGGLLSSKNH